MTFDDDFVRFQMDLGRLDVSIKSLNLDWPPPTQIIYHGVVFERVSMSQLTDEQRAEMNQLCRGAEYQVIGVTVREHGEPIQ